MRIQVYEEELGEGVELIHKVVRQHDVDGDVTFYGLRVWLKSPEEILEHSTPEDDDRSAVTFWCRDKLDLKELVRQMAEVLDHG